MLHDCIRAIDGIHVKAMLPHHRRDNFNIRKGILTQNVLVTCDFNLYFTFVLSEMMGNTHDGQILAREVHGPKINFLQPTNEKYNLVDSGFAHRSRYMAPYKGSNIRYHF